MMGYRKKLEDEISAWPNISTHPHRFGGKWIKQHLRIKAFYGTSENAVKTQIWIAVSIYVLVAIVRHGWAWRPVFIKRYRF